MNQEYRHPSSELASSEPATVDRKANSLTSARSVVLPLSGKEFSPRPVVKRPQESAATPTAHDAAGNGNFARDNDSAWLDSMQAAIRTAGELLSLLGLNAAAPDSDFGFPVFAPREWVARMRPGDPNDPLLRQVLPVSQEGEVVAGFDSDPVGDRKANVAAGVLHKYEGRALVITTGACGVHCRYCFRRSFPYQTAGSRSDAYAPTIAYLNERTEVEEVILSGGDPLTMTDAAIDRLLEKIESIGHVERLRIHSRMPIVIPSRVNGPLLERLRASRLTVWMVVHSNHANEIDEPTAAALQRLVDAGIPVLNQSVLLRGVNDDLDSLEALSRSLIRCRVIPYYLHQLDRVAGAAHFEVAAERGRELIAGLEFRLPGFAVPRYVAEISGEKSKTRL